MVTVVSCRHHTFCNMHPEQTFPVEHRATASPWDLQGTVHKQGTWEVCPPKKAKRKLKRWVVLSSFPEVHHSDAVERGLLTYWGGLRG